MRKSPALKQSRPERITAAKDMRRQFEYADGYAYNAGRMFRAVGSPEGHDPESWLDKAAPLVTGLQGYFANLDGLGADHDFDEGEIVNIETRDDEDADKLAGDTLMTYLLAHAYAMYLDSAVQELAKAS
ncbi:hypothetical protein [Singulisphaera sp. PoT]|uniref:hypothetical protein n=1 Tax=Singulisphaera sp. PoT TaxID=3411797 RepID=UPI003BF5AB9E